MISHSKAWDKVGGMDTEVEGEIKSVIEIEIENGNTSVAAVTGIQLDSGGGSRPCCRVRLSHFRLGSTNSASSRPTHRPMVSELCDALFSPHASLVIWSG